MGKKDNVLKSKLFTLLNTDIGFTLISSYNLSSIKEKDNILRLESKDLSYTSFNVEIFNYNKAMYANLVKIGPDGYEERVKRVKVSNSKDEILRFIKSVDSFRIALLPDVPAVEPLAYITSDTAASHIYKHALENNLLQEDVAEEYVYDSRRALSRVFEGSVVKGIASRYDITCHADYEDNHYIEMIDKKNDTEVTVIFNHGRATLADKITIHLIMNTLTPCLVTGNLEVDNEYSQASQIEKEIDRMLVDFVDCHYGVKSYSLIMYEDRHGDKVEIGRLQSEGFYEDMCKSLGVKMESF